MRWIIDAGGRSFNWFDNQAEYDAFIIAQPNAGARVGSGQITTTVGSFTGGVSVPFFREAVPTSPPWTGNVDFNITEISYPGFSLTNSVSGTQTSASRVYFGFSAPGVGFGEGTTMTVTADLSGTGWAIKFINITGLGSGTHTLPISAISGDPVSGRITAESGYRLKSILIDSVEQITGSSVRYKDVAFTMPSSDVSIEVSVVKELRMLVGTDQKYFGMGDSVDYVFSSSQGITSFAVTGLIPGETIHADYWVTWQSGPWDLEYDITPTGNVLYFSNASNPGYLQDTYDGGTYWYGAHFVGTFQVAVPPSNNLMTHGGNLIIDESNNIIVQS